MVSIVGVWMCLFVILVGIVCWLIVSCFVLWWLGLGLGGLVFNWVVVFIVGVVFLFVWLLFNNGLCFELLIVLGVLVMWVLVEWLIVFGWLVLVVVVIIVVMFIVMLVL